MAASGSARQLATGARNPIDFRAPPPPPTRLTFAPPEWEGAAAVAARGNKQAGSLERAQRSKRKFDGHEEEVGRLHLCGRARQKASGRASRFIKHQRAGSEGRVGRRRARNLKNATEVCRRRWPQCKCECAATWAAVQVRPLPTGPSGHAREPRPADGQQPRSAWRRTHSPPSFGSLMAGRRHCALFASAAAAAASSLGQRSLGPREMIYKPGWLARARPPAGPIGALIEKRAPKRGQLALIT